MISPTDLQFFEVSDKKIVLTWSAPGGDVSGYRVTVVPIDQSGSPQTEMTLPVTQNSYIELTHLQPGTQYRFNVYSIHNGEESLPLSGEQNTSECDSVGSGLQGNQLHFDILYLTFDLFFLEPDAPTDIHFNNVTEDSAVVLWFAPRARITGYRLFLTVEGSTPKQLRLPARLTQYTLLNLKPDTEYRVTLHSEQDNTLSEGETAVFTTSECNALPHVNTLSWIKLTNFAFFVFQTHLWVMLLISTRM